MNRKNTILVRLLFGGLLLGVQGMHSMDSQREQESIVDNLKKKHCDQSVNIQPERCATPWQRQVRAQRAHGHGMQPVGHGRHIGSSQSSLIHPGFGSSGLPARQAIERNDKRDDQVWQAVKRNISHNPEALIFRSVENNDVVTLNKVISSHSVDLNIRDHDGLTPLMVAAAEGSCEAVEMLLAAGADINAQDGDGDTVYRWLESAAPVQQGIIRNILARAGAAVNYHAALGNALHSGVKMNQCDLVKNFFDQFPDMNVDVRDAGGSTALMCAVNAGNIAMADLLIDRGANLFAKNHKGLRASNFIVAIQDPREKEKMALFLEQEEGAALEVAQEYCRETGSSLSRAFSENVAVEPLTNVALFHYAKRNDIDALQNLVATETTLNIDSTDLYGETPLMWAAGRGSVDVVSWLLKRGANPFITDIYGHRAIAFVSNDSTNKNRMAIKKLIGEEELRLMKNNDPRYQWFKSQKQKAMTADDTKRSAIDSLVVDSADQRPRDFSLDEQRIEQGALRAQQTAQDSKRSVSLSSSPAKKGDRSDMVTKLDAAFVQEKHNQALANADKAYQSLLAEENAKVKKTQDKERARQAKLRKKQEQESLLEAAQEAQREQERQEIARKRKEQQRKVQEDLRAKKEAEKLAQQRAFRDHQEETRKRERAQEQFRIAQARRKKEARIAEHKNEHLQKDARPEGQPVYDGAPGGVPMAVLSKVYDEGSPIALATPVPQVMALPVPVSQTREVTATPVQDSLPILPRAAVHNREYRHHSRLPVVPSWQSTLPTAMAYAIPGTQSTQSTRDVQRQAKAVRKGEYKKQESKMNSVTDVVDIVPTVSDTVMRDKILKALALIMAEDRERALREELEESDVQHDAEGRAELSPSEMQNIADAIEQQHSAFKQAVPAKK